MSFPPPVEISVTEGIVVFLIVEHVTDLEVIVDGELDGLVDNS